MYIFTKFPTADEGRLSDLRMNSVDNQYLWKKALSLGVNAYVLPARFRTNTWVPPESDGGVVSEDGKTIQRNVGRKSLADSMEAILGAALLTGGVEMAVQTGSRLGLCFGGEEKWSERKEVKDRRRQVGVKTTAPSLVQIEERVGYHFQDDALLITAVTHRSYSAAGACYERLENLGDGEHYIFSRPYCRLCCEH